MALTITMVSGTKHYVEPLGGGNPDETKAMILSGNTKFITLSRYDVDEGEPMLWVPPTKNVSIVCAHVESIE